MVALPMPIVYRHCIYVATHQQRKDTTMEGGTQSKHIQSVEVAIHALYNILMAQGYSPHDIALMIRLVTASEERERMVDMVSMSDMVMSETQAHTASDGSTE